MTHPSTPDAAAREAPPVSEAIARYLRVCSSGGMPRRYVDIVQLSVEEAERLGYFNDLSTTREAALIAERDQLRAAGAKLANIAFNLAQRGGEEITIVEAMTLYKCRLEWDAIPLALSAPAVGVE